MTKIEENCEKKDDLLIQLIVETKNEENNRLQSIDNKTATLIGIITIVLTLFGDICLSDSVSYRLTADYFLNNLFFTRIFLTFILCLFASLWLMIDSYSIKDYISTPTPKGLYKHYNSNQSLSDIQSIIIPDMLSMILYNQKITDEKIIKQKDGLKLLYISLIMFILFVFYILIVR